ncbi:YheC/YheD family protein [Bacillus luteolus]|uniref:YheC/YheD family protein n=1 Tax=Litchfieldia luteola TaxID=682179 RepID=A0ABR9QE56_9BACI|nr:YheC/YheD family protein [Cytobacillus luteolus]MBE4906777.1 YheC/YheD family protein [Cytobacillus luteolus]MBP1940571.1 hypothetical protein [Cytobacillus luteolus]
MNKAYPLIKSEKGKNTLFLPKSLTTSQSLTKVAFGTLSLDCEIQTSSTDEVLVSEDLYNALLIPNEGPTHIIFHEDTVFLGPLIGIFTAGFTDSGLRPIGERSLFFAKLLAVEKSVGVFTFVFGAHQINWDQGTITGYFYRKNGWEKVEVPFPNVVYDRLPNRRTENHRALKKVKQRLHEEYLIPWFNPGFFNKWEIHQLLIKEKSVAHYLPETYINPTFERIELMLSTYQHVYLKPANGSLGLGVYQIIYSKEEGAYYCRYNDDKNANRLQKFSSLESCINYLFRNKKLKDYIVQQGISLQRSDHKTIDFRVHTNKDANGKWKVSVIAGKIAGRGSVTTHLNNGGVVKTVDEIFPDKKECFKAIESLNQAALRLSHAIDFHIKGSIGEIGFDLGIDKDNKIWLFEANSKPGRSIFSHPKLRENDLHSRQLSLLYALFLTEKTIKQPEEILQL